MSEIDLLPAVAQVGFPIAVAVFLLWKGYTQDKEYLSCLVEIKAELRAIKDALEGLRKG